MKNDIESEYQVIEITDSIINSGMRLAEKYCLRGYDAVQLAAAESINTLCIANSLPQLTFVSADKELNIAAVSAGLLVENPHDYSST
ncbi:MULTISPECIES: type II toxin-antitoxin system VapC family toxin [Aphanizomenonaceae]|uniref:Type II toxin-antitoxin system VapC family toxin n=1 Tax=Dolichospermum heterosporum TAC447 TaxID=747523 RepID=A0ABY5M2M6_9CYAN|nr:MULTISPECIES: type II toxin-antitoxin system VapC family toxin [Aphanizomenonaceae]MDK2409098.1 type II toxin-antitoxin system VapC family toxin [Aphanizomenon sp. 202]MDK2458936.1 type II toxin-antitoxin system VapC family toxin [Aphanizomenon sp. PH219]UUO17158.1 type II toxin-antitoxin system VapC family toxin [Dolichospermum heterosporum TAC447]